MTRDHSHFIHFCQMSHRWGRPLNPTGHFTPSSPISTFPMSPGPFHHDHRRRIGSRDSRIGILQAITGADIAQKMRDCAGMSLLWPILAQWGRPSQIPGHRAIPAGGVAERATPQCAVHRRSVSESHPTWTWPLWPLDDWRAGRRWTGVAGRVSRNVWDAATQQDSRLDRHWAGVVSCTAV